MTPRERALQIAVAHRRTAASDSNLIDLIEVGIKNAIADTKEAAMAAILEGVENVKDTDAELILRRAWDRVRVAER